MDEARAAEVLDQLVRWGLVEERDGDVRPTRRWAAKLQASAEKLNVLAGSDRPPAGNPLVLAVSQALAHEGLTGDEALHADAVRVLVTLELTRMAPDKRAQHGFGDARL